MIDQRNNSSSCADTIDNIEEVMPVTFVSVVPGGVKFDV